MIEDPKTAVAMHRWMVLSRVLDEACCQESAHWFPSRGEEAVPVGTFYGLRPDDVCAPGYRGSPIVFVMRGVRLEQVWAGALGKRTSFGRGRHFSFTAPIELRVLPYIAGDLGPIISQATGTAFAQKYRKSDAVTAVSFGDGTSNRGDFHEAVNLGAAWRLPIVYVIQNNHWAISMPIEKATAAKRLADRAAGYGIPGVAVDGNDVLAVHAAVQEAVRRARAGHGPTLIEAETFRMRGHIAADTASYRSAAQVEEWQGRDPIRRLEERLLAAGVLSAEEAQAVWAEAAQEVGEAKAAAQRHPDILPTDLGLDEIFSTPLGGA
ncbi:MAG: thiamine pyrophosphate-dependent dehydrogenase E1 component subunit alpha [candidate division NC10 bacterium]|nr:thiamine pyrophosphate-dependent dehydrogenase E1 component subunit alpha [candidate division NC10 bacterium]